MNVFEPFVDRSRPDRATTGTLHGVGLGPGAPDLLTVRAVRIVQSSPAIAYFAKRGRKGIARTIVDPWLPTHAEEIPLVYPMTTERHFADPHYVAELGAFYAEAAETLAGRLGAGLDVALLCEGDPMFYGSFMHLFVRLRDRFEVQMTAGISGMSGCWSAAGLPMTWGDDILTVLPGTLGLDALTERLRLSDAAVIMKLGTNFPKVRAAVEAAGLTARAVYVERGTMAGERIVPLREMTDERAPYFSMILVPGEGRRP
jgi:precorrin-2/cobalt-factor-2 C20-methyltransferase